MAFAAVVSAMASRPTTARGSSTAKPQIAPSLPSKNSWRKKGPPKSVAANTATQLRRRRK